MNIHRERVQRSIGLTAALCVVAWPVASRAATLTFPSASCSSTLQSCVDGAAPSDIVEVATAGPINESLTIDKSLTVRPAAGFSPVFGDFSAVTLSNQGESANSITFEGFTFSRGFLQAVQVGTKAFDVRIRNLVFADTFNDRTPIEVRTNFPGPYGPVAFEITDNVITIPSAFTGVQAISANGGNASTFHGTISGNLIEHHAGGQNGGIGVFNDTSDLAVDVIGNRVIGNNFNEGLSLFQFGPGSADVRFINNLVEGQVNEAGRPAAVSIDVSAGEGTFEVLNNTLVDSDTGISIGGRDDLGATWSGVVANNIVANMVHQGVTIDDPFTSVINEFNLVSNTGPNFFTPGPGTVFSDPQFVGGGDFHLSSGSPARDAGTDARVPADITFDLDGDPRIRGASVDMGAYERVPEPSAPVMLLTGMLAIFYCRSRVVSYFSQFLAPNSEAVAQIPYPVSPELLRFLAGPKYG
jgi:hypothetical protein